MEHTLARLRIEEDKLRREEDEERAKAALPFKMGDLVEAQFGGIKWYSALVTDVMVDAATGVDTYDVLYEADGYRESNLPRSRLRPHKTGLVDASMSDWFWKGF